MSRWAWCNGRLCAEGELYVPVRDGAVLYGASLFETLRCYNGHPFRLEQHLQRLRRWLERLRLFRHAREEVELRTPVIRQAIASVLEANGWLQGDVRVRLTVTAGSEKGTPLCFLLAERIPPEQVAQWRSGVTAALLPDPRSVQGEQPKWGNYAWHLEAQQLAREQGADEAIWFNGRGYLTEGALSNVFVWHEECLLTPPVEEGILAGVARQVVLEIAPQMGIECREEPIPIDLLPHVQAIFLTNSVREVVPVTRLGQRHFRTHPVVTSLQEAYRQQVQREVEASQ
ncbi:MAG: aminotransferase class IV [Armatimonadota bacterium]|nr:aminotransferase class IV [bacterium]MDW8289879.1 aminotransferase class IV [Armatimonadota bacterium]